MSGGGTAGGGSTNGDGKGKETGGSPARGPIGKEAARAPLAKRFYEEAAASKTEEGCLVLLDGRPMRTPGKRRLAVSSIALAEAIAAEWGAQEAVSDPATMPLTRIVNSAIDGVAERTDEVAADIVAFAESDLLCYRAEGPPELADRQGAAWDPVVAWAESVLGARVSLAAGVMPIEQPTELRVAIGSAVGGLDPLSLAALHVMTTLTGSALLALAHARGRLTSEEAWAAAHVDEDWQIEQWGADSEAAERRAFRRGEFAAASLILELLGR
jgi:chaperone required for assembly of F1-ATPase